MEPGGSCGRWSPAVPEGNGQGACTSSYRQPADSSNEGENEQDAIVHIEWEPGQVLNRRYRLHSKAGEGAFGRVCLTKKRQVAIKIIRDVKQFREAAQEEAEVLATICAADPWGQFRCCWMHTSFLHDSRFFCMVLEPLGCSLHEFTKENDYRGFWLQPARPEWFPREEFCEVQGDEVLCKKKRSRPVRASRSSTLATRFGNMIAARNSSTRGSIGGPENSKPPTTAPCGSIRWDSLTHASQRDVQSRSCRRT